MSLSRVIPGLLFCIFFVGSCFTNKYVLSVLNFTFPTVFQGWQTCTGALLLWVTGKLGWVEINSFSRSAAVSWLPASVLFLGNIYSGSKALSILPVPVFFVLQNVSEVVFSLLVRFTQKERSSWMKTFSENLVLMSAVTLALHNLQFGVNGYVWAVIHLCCVGDLFGALEFPFRTSYKFHSGCFASAILSFFLVLSSVKLKNRLSSLHCAVWLFLAKILASGLSIFIFSADFGPLTLCCILVNHVGEALAIHANRVLES